MADDKIKNPQNPLARKLGYFSRVKEAREYLKEQCKELVELQKMLILQAAANKDFEAALKANQWLIEHMPAEDGERVIDSSASKVPETQQVGKLGPQINIGIKFGGVNDAPQVIDITPVKGELDE